MSIAFVVFVTLSLLACQSFATPVPSSKEDVIAQTLAEEKLPGLDDLDRFLEQELTYIQERLGNLKVDKSETNLKLPGQEAKIDSLLEQNNALTNQLSELFDDGSQDKMAEKREAADSPAGLQKRLICIQVHVKILGFWVWRTRC